jgi:hypothetical protein
MSFLYRWITGTSNKVHEKTSAADASAAAPAPRPPQEEVSETIHLLRESVAELTSRELALQKEIQANKEEAKERLKKNDKKNAELYLRKAKLLETQLSETISNKFNLGAQISTLQNSAFTNQLVANMERTRETFRSLGRNRDPSYVQSLVQEVTDEMNKSASVQSALAGPLIDTGDVKEELAHMQEEIDRELEIEADLAMLQLPDPPRSPVRAPTQERVAPREPRIIRVEGGTVKDSRRKVLSST